MKNESHLIQTPFSLRDVIVVGGIVILLLLLLSLPILPVEDIVSQIPIAHSVRILLLFSLQSSVFIVPLFLLSHLLYKKAFFVSLHLYRVPLLRCILSVMGWYIFFVIFSIVLLTLIKSLGWEIPGYGAGRDIVPLFGNDQYTFLVMLVVIVVLAPMTEELFFRGFLLMTVWKSSNFIVATIFTAGIFAIVHLDFNAFFPRLLLGFILNYLGKQHNGSIVPSLVFHMMNNSIALLIQL